MALQVPRGPTMVQRMENCCEGDALASWSVSLNRPTQQSKGKQKGEAPGGHPAAHPFPGPAGLSNFYQTPLSTPRVVSPGSSGEGSAGHRETMEPRPLPLRVALWAEGFPGLGVGGF